YRYTHYLPSPTILLQPSRHHRHLHSFPTRRSSDLHLERLHLEIHGVLCREHQHRQVLAAIAQGAQHLEARQRRKTQVEHEHIVRSEEHTSELQSRGHLVCRLLLEKKKKKKQLARQY